MIANDYDTALPKKSEFSRVNDVRVHGFVYTDFLPINLNHNPIRKTQLSYVIP